MPFTPLHMGPGMLLKALFQGSFSLLVFGWTQIVMDIQPLIVLLSGEGHMHGFTHTFVGSTLIALLSLFTGKYLGEFILHILKIGNQTSISWKVATISSFIGSYSHVLLDAIMHTDVEPFFPINKLNPFFGYLYIPELHKFCFYSGFIGILIYFSIIYFTNKKNNHATIKDTH